jgi:hypothetical protein
MHPFYPSLMEARNAGTGAPAKTSSASTDPEDGMKSGLKFILVFLLFLIYFNLIFIIFK